MLICLRPLFSFLADDQGSGISSMMQDLAFAIPGVDEAMGFAEVMKYVCRLLPRNAVRACVRHSFLTFGTKNNLTSPCIHVIFHIFWGISTFFQ